MNLMLTGQHIKSKWVQNTSVFPKKVHSSSYLI